MIYNRVRWRLCTVSFLKTSLIKNVDFRCCLGGVCAAATKTGSQQRDFYFLVVCIRTFIRVLRCYKDWV
jgi:hypothetical protein